jgi:hypothetical protein
LVEGSKKVGLCRPEAPIELGEELDAVVGGDDPAGSPIGRIRAAFDHPRRLEVVEQVGHDRAVNAQPGREHGLAAWLVPRGGGQHLVAAMAARQALGHGVGRLDVPAEHHGQPPAKLLREALGHHAHAPIVRPPVGFADSL